MEIFGISRHILYSLLRDGLITSYVLRRPGVKRGRRLFHIPSVRAHIESQQQ